MPAKDVEVKMFETKYMCDTVGCNGELKPTGVMLMTEPPQFPHKCPICKSEQTFFNKYPLLSYRYV